MPPCSSQSPRCRTRPTDQATVPPCKQGSLDSLCGIYAIVNAVRLLRVRNHKPANALSDYLFGALLGYAEARWRLSRVATQGLATGSLWLLAHEAQRLLSRRTNLDLQLKRPFRRSPPADWQAFEQQLRTLLSDGAVLIARCWGPSDHWTVVRGFTRSRMLLCDSNGVHHYRLARCGLAGEQPVGTPPTRIFSPGCVIALTMTPQQL